ncbi:GAF domain protein [Verrucomicrobiia bacterium DG1235]|nr:GAF domain protein [Verrucomicrobiae bacterium DG1235]
MQFDDQFDSVRFERLLDDAVDPVEFWNVLAQFLSEQWRLAQTAVLHVASASEVRLLGQFGSGGMAAMPGSVRRAVVDKGGAKMQVLSEGSDRWLVAPLTRADGIVFVLIAQGGDGLEKDASKIVSLAQAILSASEARQSAQRSSRSLDHFAKIVDLGLLLGESVNFDPAAMTLCSEVAHHLKAMRVTLSWRAGDKLKLVATSHGGRVRNDTEAAGSLLRVMEESFDQAIEIAEPPLENDALNLQHRLYSESNANCRVISLPIRFEEKSVGVLTVEHPQEENPVGQEDIETLRVILDLVAPRLEEMHRKTGWYGARLWRTSRRFLAGFIGYRHTGWKFTGLALVLFTLVALVVRIEHKVKTTFILKSEASAYLTAPFPGYIDQVHRDVGDIVEADDLLMELDRRELVVQLAELNANRDRNLTDARRLEGEGELTEMRLAQLAAQQVEAKIAVLDYRLSKTELRAPFDGIIVEGDLRERLSSPVQAGETLYRLVKLEGLYGELRVDERDINYLFQDQVGQMAFTSRPYDRYDVRLDQFEPVAIIEESGTYFRVRIHLVDAPDEWWRPGMSGVCKVDAGKRSVAWILMHRTVEFFRMLFWL